MSNQNAFTLTATGPHLQTLIKRRIGELESKIATARELEEVESRIPGRRRHSDPFHSGSPDIGSSEELGMRVRMLTTIHDLIDHEASSGGCAKVYQLTLVDLARMDLIDVLR